MLSSVQIDEIKEHLNRAQNPVFFFDNDQDGLCSFLLLQKYIGRGKGVPVKTFPSLDPDYFRKVTEFSADYIFILDKPVVSAEFFDQVSQVNIPVVWIDHHEIDKDLIPDFVNYYNPMFNSKPTHEPVTALCQQINDRTEDLWIAVVGCISDKYYPEFYSKFRKAYMELTVDSQEPFDIFYGSDIGKVARMLGAGLKDRITNAITMVKFLIKAKGPYDVLNETSGNSAMHKRYNDLAKKQKKFVDKAISESKDKYILFKYGGTMSISSDLANELSYRFPEKKIIVVYLSGIKANISARGEHIRKIVLEAIKDIPDATGGGHECAVGAQMKVNYLDVFEEKIKDLL